MTTPPSDRPLRAGLAAGLLTFCLCAMTAWAGDLTTDDLTVNHDLTVQDTSGTNSAPTNGLSLYYSFTTNATPVADESGNGHTGTVYGATWISGGACGGGYSFDGNGDYIDANWQGVTSLPFTVSFWFKRAAVTGGSDQDILWAQGQGVAVNYCALIDIYYQTGQIRINAQTGGQVYTPSSYTDNTWHQGTFVLNSTSYIYIDGELKASGGTTITALTGYNMIFGADTQSRVSAYMYKGSMDEARIYNRALSSNEVHELYLHDSSPTAGTVTFATGIQYIKPLGDVLMGSFTNNP
jgi:hypothetical protein